MKLQLAEIAHARSGDKADRADIGLFAWDAAGFELLLAHVGREQVAAHFAHLMCSDDAQRVECYPLPNLLAIKFVLNGALNGGAARSLRSDSLGKTIGAQLLRMQIEVPEEAARAALAGARQAIAAF
jgi:hypothetical protein